MLKFMISLFPEMLTLLHFFFKVSQNLFVHQLTMLLFMEFQMSIFFYSFLKDNHLLIFFFLFSSRRLLEETDIINIDVSVFLEGFHGDCSATFLVSDKVDEKGKRLVSHTKKCLELGIEVCGHERPMKLIGNTIEYVYSFNIYFRQLIIKKQKKREYSIANGYSVNEDYCGHGIGENFHEFPIVLHTRRF